MDRELHFIHTDSRRNRACAWRSDSLTTYKHIPLITGALGGLWYGKREQ